MRLRVKKTKEMLVYNIHWTEVADQLNISVQSLLTWRNSDVPERIQAIDLAIKSIIEKRKQNG